MSTFGKLSICPICGKSFPPAPKHSLTDGKGHLVCSPHCSTFAYTERKKRQQKKRARAEQRRAEYEALKNNAKKQEIKVEKKREIPSSRKPVFVLSKDGTLLKRYPSVTEAARATGYATTTVSHICRGTKKATGEYTFKYEREEDKTLRQNRGAWKAVLQFTEDGNLVARHETVGDAAKAVCSSSASISKCCHNVNKSVGGFVFMFESEFNEFDKKKG